MAPCFLDKRSHVLRTCRPQPVRFMRETFYHYGIHFTIFFRPKTGFHVRICASVNPYDVRSFPSGPCRFIEFQAFSGALADAFRMPRSAPSTARQDFKRSFTARMSKIIPGGLGVQRGPSSRFPMHSDITLLVGIRHGLLYLAGTTAARIPDCSENSSFPAAPRSTQKPADTSPPSRVGCFGTKAGRERAAPCPALTGPDTCKNRFLHGN